MTQAQALPAGTQRRVALPFLLCTLIWGSTWFVIASQLRYLPAGWLIADRFMLASAAMFAVAAVRGERLRLGAAGQRMAVAVGITQFTFNYLFVYAAEAHIASGLVALVSALLIVPNALFGWLFLGQSVSRRFLLGSTIAVAGLALLFVHESRHGGTESWRTIMGVLLSLGGVLAASTANVLQGSARVGTLPPAALLAWSMAYGAAIDCLVALATDGAPSWPSDPTFLAGLLYLALVGSALTFTLYLGLIRAIGPAQAGYIGVLVPIIAMALSTLFEGYRWSVPAAAGAALVLIGLLVAVRARKPSRQDG